MEVSLRIDVRDHHCTHHIRLARPEICRREPGCRTCSATTPLLISLWQGATPSRLNTYDPSQHGCFAEHYGQDRCEGSRVNSRLDRVGDWPRLARKAGYEPKKLAALCRVSLRQLERYCRAAFRSSPRGWLNRLRIERSKKLLKRPLMVKEIAYSLSFKQTSHFTREFKRRTGVPPTSFRQARK